MIPTGQVPPEFLRGIRQVREIRKEEDAYFILRAVGSLVGVAMWAGLLFYVIRFAGSR